MAHYKIGKVKNNRRLACVWEKVAMPQIENVAEISARTLIVRGIGYRAFTLKNDLLAAPLDASFVESTRPVHSAEISVVQELSVVAAREFSQALYLIVRAGHTRDLILPVNDALSCVTSKKDRKLTLASASKILAANLARRVYNYRTPSAYTGRGVRVKHERPMRKAGKKDKQRGRAF